MKIGYECTAYFRGIDGLGTCDTDCQWWFDGACPCAKGSKLWDGKEYYLKEPKRRKNVV
jgi:hypothetical protein